MASDGKDKTDAGSDTEDAPAIWPRDDAEISAEDAADLEALDGVKTSPDEAGSGDQPSENKEISGVSGPESERASADPEGAGASDAPDGNPVSPPPREVLVGGDPLDAEATRTERPEAVSAEQTGSAPDAAPAATAKRGGFVPLVLGGAVAAALGFGAATMTELPFFTGAGGDDPLAARIDGLAAEQEALAAALDAKITDAVAAGTGPLRDEMAELAGSAAEASRAGVAALEERVSELGQTLGAVEERLTAMEKRPIADNVSREAIAAYEREINAMQETVAAQRAEFEALLEEARTVEAGAEETERMAEIRAALGKIRAAVDTGAPYASDLATLEDLTGAEVPEALVDPAENGVPTLPVLQRDFPDAARAALAATRADAAEGGGVGAFFARQLGARSITPREGDDPDAILSRAGASLSAGALEDALAELAALPDVASSAMADWTNAARARQEAIAAAETLAADFTQD
ncbi:COG4223 family protein [Poseidonocella sedimentorum]|uniref:COG4223 family protein n=1 Tax=Poseidonocella sedimentorum TaxID=871652 RepID=UPI000B87AF93|nr:hypothetical protein [Poseidonocella sedimentorum]